MIRSARRRHLWLWLGLAVLLPVLLFLSLRSRPEEPLMETLPDALLEHAVSAGDEP